MPPPVVPAHHDFETVMQFLRQQRAKGSFGATVLQWRGHDIVHVKHEEGFKPGELPMSTR